jgi:hypothetical protein
MNDILLNNTIYPANSILRVAGLFSNIATFDIEQLDYSTIVHVSSCKVEFSLLKNEFCNYLIYSISTCTGE